MLSVIVPVYNAEKYLEKCIKSIICQTYVDIEIILVDDGSVDTSGQICDTYMKIDSRIKVIHIENSGAITARKKGVELATGEVVTFVDSDDWIENDMYENLMKVYMRYKPNIVTSGFYVGETKDKVVVDSIGEGFYHEKQIKEEIVPKMMSDWNTNTWGVTGALWNKVFDRDLLLRIVKMVNNEMSLGDDASVVYPAIIEASSIYVVQKAWYHYLYNRVSMCNSCTLSDFAGVSLLQKEFERKFKEYNIWNVMEQQLGDYIKNVISLVIKGVYNIELTSVSYLFPYELIPSQSRIALYGAGVVGKSYWKCLRKQKYAKLVAWVDCKYDEIVFYEGVNIESPKTLADIEFEFVVIAILDKKRAKEIEKYLLDLKIPKQKIVWTIPEYVG